MTEKKGGKPRRLSREILGVLGVCAAISLFVFWFLNLCALAVIDGIISAQELVLTELQQMQVDGWTINISLVIAVLFFVVLFLFLLGERLSYIRELFKGIDALRDGQLDYRVPVEGSNELSQLAQEINYLSDTQRKVKEREGELAREKELLIRALSHDIRTPLTSILSYSQLLAHGQERPVEEQREYLRLIEKKAEQIKGLTDILLDGGNRAPERFEDGRLLMEQLVEAFEEELEDGFALSIDLSGCGAFSGSFVVDELRRIFDNLSTNIQKYAAPARPVALSVAVEDGILTILQRNYVHSPAQPVESFQMGLNSIRRIAHNYGGRVEVRRDDDIFEIVIALSEF